MNSKKKRFSVQERVQSFSYSFQGIKTLLKEEHNARIHVVASILTLIAGLYFRLDTLEWCVIILSIGMVICTESMNSAIERVVDFVSPEYHEQAGKIKDLASGAVLICSIAALIVGTLIFIPKLWMILHG